MIEQTKEWGVIGGVAIILALTLLQGWFMFVEGEYTNPPVVFSLQEGATHFTTRLVYKPGEVVEARTIAVKSKDRTAWLQWGLWNGSKMIKAYPSRMGWLQKGYNDRIVPIEELPHSLPPGKYRFVGSIEYNLHLKSVYIDVHTNWFEVKRDGDR